MKATMEIKFTVITVVYNAEATIRKTIDSVLNQKLMPYEYIIIDGQSKDDTFKIAEEYVPFFAQKKVKYILISEKDSGLYNAMNKGIKYATGDFVSFLNAGDWYELDALLNIQTFYNEEEFDLTYGGIHYIKTNGSIIDKMSKVDRFLISSRNWNHPSMFLRTEKYRYYKFNEKYKIYADFNLYLKLRNDKTKIRVINKIISNFVADGVSTNTNIDKVLARAKEKYSAYRENGYGHIYWIESYGWEIIKSIYLRIQR